MATSKSVENEALAAAKKLVSEIEAVAVPQVHRYAGMVQSKLNEAKTWAEKAVEELSGEAQNVVSSVEKQTAPASDTEKTQ